VTRQGTYDNGLSHERTKLAWQRTLLVGLTMGALAFRLTWPLRLVPAVLGGVGLVLMLGAARATGVRVCAALLFCAASLWCLAALVEVAASG